MHDLARAGMDSDSIFYVGLEPDPCFFDTAGVGIGTIFHFKETELDKDQAICRSDHTTVILSVVVRNSAITLNGDSG